MNKIKIIILIGILGYLGFWGWRRYQGEGAFSSVPTRTMSSDTEEVEEGFLDIPTNQETKVSPLEKHHQELRNISNDMLSSLTGQHRNETSRLRVIWNQAQSDFNQGWIPEADAATLASLIRELNEMNADRMLYDERYMKIKNYKPGDFERSVKLEDKKRFAKQQLDRQWKDWVYVNRAKLDSLFANLSE